MTSSFRAVSAGTINTVDVAGEYFNGPGPGEQRERELLCERRQQPTGFAAPVAPESAVHERP